MRAVRTGRAALFLRSKRCPRASFALLQGAHTARRKRRDPLQSAPEFPKRAIRFSPPALALNGECLQRALPPLKGRLLHAAFSPCRTPCENRPPISLCALPFHPLHFALKALPPRVIRRAFNARIPTGESGATHCKARPNFRAAFPPLTLTSERLQSHPPRSRLKPFTPR